MLLRDLMRNEDVQITAVVDVITRNKPDIIVLQGIDWDLDNKAAKALQALLGAAGSQLDHLFADQPNSGLSTGIDLDGDGRLGGPADAQGYGKFMGQGGLLVLSRFPVIADDVQVFSELIWAEQANTLFPYDALSEDAAGIQRLSTTAHWIIPFDTPHGRLSLGTFAASPPVFDGPEDRNGRRNHDEVHLWTRVLNGDFGAEPVGFVLAGNANLDPNRGEGRREAIQNLLAHPDLQDPGPKGPTVDWPDPKPGDLRVSYILPSRTWRAIGSGIDWPDADTPEGQTSALASRHRLIWVDLMPAP